MSQWELLAMRQQPSTRLPPLHIPIQKCSDYLKTQELKQISPLSPSSSPTSFLPSLHSKNMITSSKSIFQSTTSTPFVPANTTAAFQEFELEKETTFLDTQPKPTSQVLSKKMKLSSAESISAPRPSLLQTCDIQFWTIPLLMELNDRHRFVNVIQDVVIHPCLHMIEFEACIKDITCPELADHVGHRTHSTKCRHAWLHTWMKLPSKSTQPIPTKKGQFCFIEETFPSQLWILYRTESTTHWSFWTPQEPKRSNTITPDWLGRCIEDMNRVKLYTTHSTWYVALKTDDEKSSSSSSSDTIQSPAELFPETRWWVLFCTALHVMNSNEKSKWLEWNESTSSLYNPPGSNFTLEKALKWIQFVPSKDAMSVHTLNKSRMIQFKQWVEKGEFSVQTELIN